MTRITYVLGTTCVGKSTLIEKAAEYSKDVHIIQVGKELRRRHPPEYFQGKGAMDFTEHEVEEIFSEEVHKAAMLGKCEILVDGNPRSIEQLYLLGLFPAIEPRFWWINAKESLVEKWLNKRFAGDYDGRELAQQRIINDRVQLYPLLFTLQYEHDVQFVCINMVEGFGYSLFFGDEGI